MRIVNSVICMNDIKEAAGRYFGDMVKAVVDVEREIIALDAELHSDLETLLLQDGSFQENLWGINFYPDLDGVDFVEFDSMINIRPAQGNRSRGVDDQAIRAKIISIVEKRIDQQ